MKKSALDILIVITLFFVSIYSMASQAQVSKKVLHVEQIIQLPPAKPVKIKGKIILTEKGVEIMTLFKLDIQK